MMHQSWYYGKAFYSFVAAPPGFAEMRHTIDHNAPFIRLAAAKRVAIKRAARIVHNKYVRGHDGNV